MNVEKYLIILKGEDKTKDIIKYNAINGKIYITFYNSEKQYSYSKNDFKFYKDPKKIDISDMKVILNQGYIYNVKKILQFEEHYKIFFNDDSIRLELIENIKLIKERDMQNEMSEDKFEYFKEISKIVSVRTEDGTALLAKEYEKVNFIESNTVLYQYLNSLHQNKIQNIDDMRSLIFPFGSNKSQFQAVNNVMKSRISVIEGPPGTGKTQTILNIIANIVKNKQTVAVVSNNNAAIENVYEKLKQYGFEYICAILGKRENKESFIKNQAYQYPYFQDISENKCKLENEISKLNIKLDNIFSTQNNIAILKEKLNQIKIEHEYFKKYEQLINFPKIRSLHTISSKNIMRLKVELEDKEGRKEKLGLWFKIRAVLLLGIGNFQFYKKSEEEIIKCYNDIYFMINEYELNKEIIRENEKLNFLKSKDEIKLLIDYSTNLLNECLREKYNEKEIRPVFTIKELYTNSARFNQEYPVIFSTTHSIKDSLNPDYKFDYIIMDESSQVDLITGVLALSCARNAVIVGDKKQLPNVISSENRKEIEEISKRYNIAENYDYLKQSFLTSIINSLPNIPRVLLREHYRCHPKIIEFCNRKFYNNELIIMTEDKGEEDVMKVYVTTKGNHEREHFNQRQIDVIKQEILPELETKTNFEQIGIISPYRNQRDALEKTICEEDIQIDTIHKFQGRERDAIIITTVDNEISEFVDDPKILNVAITRAKRYLRLVVSNNNDNSNNINDLIKYIQYNNFEIVKSKVKSIYDLLHKANRQERLEYLKNKKRISEYDSENITYNKIKEILQKNSYDNLDIVSHIPLIHILDDINLLEKEELEYVNNLWTHVDFVIYNKMDKKIVIAVEVDGYYFHKEGTKQNKRDEIKNRILKKYDISLVRLNTIGSGEEEILENKIKEVLENTNVKEKIFI